MVLGKITNLMKWIYLPWDFLYNFDNKILQFSYLVIDHRSRRIDKIEINFDSSTLSSYVLLHIGHAFILSVQDNYLRVDARQDSSQPPGLVIIQPVGPLVQLVTLNF